MSALQAIPTPHGIEILNSELKQTVTKYQLVGALTHDAGAETLYTFHAATIETSYYDENGVLTFILNLPIETHFDEYLHRIDVLDSQNQAVIECPTPKIALAKGIGGMVTLKAAIKGQAGDVVFKHGEYLTETELKEIYLPPIQFQPWNAERIYQTGEICTRMIDGEFRVMQMYAGPNMTCVGKDPADSLNRHLGWQSLDAPFWWIDYKADLVGMPFYWLDTRAPEWAVIEINVDLPTAVYWRLARCYPHLVRGDVINTGEIRGEFLRVLDQGRGVDSNRQIGTYQAGTKIAGEVGITSSANGHTIHNINNVFGDPVYETAAQFDTGIQYYGSNLIHTAGSVGYWRTVRPRNVSRPMAIAI